MAPEDSSNESIPYYYEDNPEDDLSLMPFLVAPLGDFQATLILGPQSVAAQHDKFIDSLYRQYTHIDHIKGMYVRAFIFNSRLCLSITLPTSLKDKGGREGLSISIGLFAKRRIFGRFNSVLTAYLKIFLENLNRCFSLSLPTIGADKLLETIQKSHNSKDAFDIFVQLLTTLDVLFVASRTIEGLLKTIPWYKAFRFWLWKRKRTSPKTILYPPNANYEEVLAIFLKELNRNLNRLGKTGIEELFDNSDLGIVSLLPTPQAIINARKVRLGNYRGQPYYRIY